MMEKKEKVIESGKEESAPIVIRNTTDLQRLRLAKLMKNPDKPVVIPENPKERGVPLVPDFVRNVMGSSAGAGSGEFHVYRHLRRKEFARQRYMKERAERERLDVEYWSKLEENKKKAEQKTEKRRKRRLKKKSKQRGSNKKAKQQSESEQSATDDSEDCASAAASSAEDQEIKPATEQQKPSEVEPNDANDETTDA